MTNQQVTERGADWDTARMLKEAGNELFKSNNYQGAIDKYREAISLKPDFKQAYCNMGRCLSKLDQKEAALASFNEAVSLDPKYVKAHFYRDNIMGAIKAQVYFGCLDLKLTDSGDVKLLEYGTGFRSSFSGFAELHHDASVRDMLHNNLEKFGLPFYTGHQPGMDPPHARHFTENNYLETWSQPQEAFNPVQLSTYRGIYGGQKVPELPENVLLMNAPGIGDFVLDDKIHFARMMSEISPQHRPVTAIVSKTCQQNQLEEIQTKLQNDGFVYCVIKLRGGVRGEGVKICRTENLVQSFRELFSLFGLSKAEIESHLARPNMSRSEESLKFSSDENSSVIIESYETSKQVFQGDMPYDATMRMAFMVTRDAQQTNMQPLGAYWKLPSSSMTEEKARDNSISSFNFETHEELSTCVAAVSDVDKEKVFSQLECIIPQLFNTAWSINPEQILDDIEDHEEKLRQLCQIAFHYGGINQFVLAHHYVDRAIKLKPRHYLGHHNKGRIYTLEGKYNEAIACLSKAEDFGGGADSIYRRLEAYYLKDDFGGVNNCMESLRGNAQYLLKLRAFDQCAKTWRLLQPYHYHPERASTETSQPSTQYQVDHPDTDAHNHAHT